MGSNRRPIGDARPQKPALREAGLGELVFDHPPSGPHNIRFVAAIGLPPKKGRRDAPATISVKDLALGLSPKKWRTIKWREGTNEWLSSRFARVRDDPLAIESNQKYVLHMAICCMANISSIDIIVQYISMHK
jgi:hypothetical protein